jgi:hypothetical protein
MNVHYCIKCEKTIEEKETELINFEDDQRIILDQKDYQSYPKKHINCGGEIITKNIN